MMVCVRVFGCLSCGCGCTVGGVRSGVAVGVVGCAGGDGKKKKKKLSATPLRTSPRHTLNTRLCVSIAPPAHRHPSSSTYIQPARTPSPLLLRIQKMRAAPAPRSPASGALARPRPAASARSVRAAAAPPPPRDTSSSAAPPTKSGYPGAETSASDTGLLPRREPGSFPSPTLVAAWNRLSVELVEGADTGAPPAPAGVEAAFDPLRDGPARYLGYSNECG